MPRIAHALLDSETGYAAVIRAGRHELTADEPSLRGGTDTGPAPYELLLASLAACTAITLRMVAARKGWELGSIHVDLELHKDAEGRRDHRDEILVSRIGNPVGADERCFHGFHHSSLTSTAYPGGEEWAISSEETS